MMRQGGLVPATERSAAFWAGVSEDLREQMAAVFSTYGITRYLVYERSILATIWDRELLLASGRPVSFVVELCRLMIATAAEVKPLAQFIELPDSATTGFALVDCGYCGSQYGLDKRAKCPNCGAGYQPPEASPRLPGEQA